MNSDTKSRPRPFVWIVLVAVFLLGFAVATAFFRREMKALVRRRVPYDRRPATVTNPALIINRWSGDGKADRYGLADKATKAGIKVIMLQKGDDLTQLARDAVDAGADAIGMAGGDGSLGLVAGVAMEHDVPFFCVPVGTRNHFALDVGLDRDDPMSALDAFEEGEEISIDHGIIGERVFLNNASFGVYAMAVQRDGYRENKEETIAAVLREQVGNPAAQAQIRYTTPDGQQHERAPLLLISNNRYTFHGPPDYGRREELNTGQLGMGAVTGLPEGSAVMPLAELRSLHEWELESIRLESDEPILAGVDGEALTFDSPLELSVRPKALRILVPAGTQPGYIPGGEAVAARLLDLAQLGGEDET